MQVCVRWEVRQFLLVAWQDAFHLSRVTLPQIKQSCLAFAIAELQLITQDTPARCEVFNT